MNALEGPKLTVIGDSVWIVWPGWTAEFSRVYDHRESLSAEVSVVDETLGALHVARLNLLSTQGKSGLARQLEDTCPTRPWRELVEQSCRLLLRHLRQAHTGVYLQAKPPPANQWLVEERIRRDDITVVYGDGGTGKSLFALALGVYGLLGHPFGSWRIQPVTRILYLDWETDQASHESRLYGLTKLLEQIAPEAIEYHRLHRPIADDITGLRACADRHAADLVICDSLGAACGSEPETPGAAVQALMALRSLRGTKLVIAHVSKAIAEGGQGSKPFGSVYVHNLARSTFFAKAGEDEGDQDVLSMTLYHRKSNYGRRTKPAGFRFGFNMDGAISVQAGHANLAADTLPAQILAELRGGKKSARDLAESLDKAENNIRARLGELKAHGKVIEFRALSAGRGHKSEWALPDTKRTADES